MTSKRIMKEQQRLSIADSNYITQKKSGIDFFASGSNPEPWTLQMNFDHKITFRTQTHGHFQWFPIELVADASDNTTTYNSKDQSLVLSISSLPCEEKHQKNDKTKQVNIVCNKITYTGCGGYLKNNLLHNKWMLERIDDVELKRDNKKNESFIEFDLLKNKVSGNDGCNRFFGLISIEGDRIKFSTLASTRMACSSPAIINTTLIDNRLVDYYFKEGKLILYLINDSKLTFRKEY